MRKVSRYVWENPSSVLPSFFFLCSVEDTWFVIPPFTPCAFLRLLSAVAILSACCRWESAINAFAMSRICDIQLLHRWRHDEENISCKELQLTTLPLPLPAWRNTDETLQFASLSLPLSLSLSLPMPFLRCCSCCCCCPYRCSPDMRYFS